MRLLWSSLCFCFVVFGVAKLAHFDLYVTSAPVGHHVPLQPLVTGPHLHPSPASCPPFSSSPSTLPSSSQSSLTGPPRFSFSYPLFPYDSLLLVQGTAPSVSASILFCRFLQLTLHPSCVLFAVSICVPFLGYLSLHINSCCHCCLKKRKDNVTLQPVLQK